MNLPSTRQVFQFPNFPTGQQSGATPFWSNAMGTIQEWQIDQTFPTEAILIRLYLAITATALAAPTSPANIYQVDWIKSLLQTIQIQIQDTARTVYQMSGACALEFAWLSGFNLHPSTMSLIQSVALGTSIPANSEYILEYLIPLVPMNAGEDLRTLMLLPTHLYTNPALLTVTFGQTGNMGTGGAIGVINADIVRYGRRMNPTVEATIKSKFGGYIAYDILEGTFNPAASTNPQNVPLSIPGWYWNMFFRHYLGGSSYARNCLDAAGIGGGAASTTAGVTTLTGGFTSENLWTLNWGQNTYRQWKWRDLYGEPRYRHALNSNNFTYSPDVGGTVINTTNFVSPSSGFIDFAGDGITAEPVTELGSVFDTTTPNAQRQAVYVTGQFAVATPNASVLSFGGQRLLASNNITQFQMFGGAGSGQ